MQTGKVEIELGGQTLRCHWSYDPGTPDVYHLPNGDPGYPGDPPEFWVTKVEMAAHLITPSGNKIAERWLDVGDLINECSGGEVVQELAQVACEDDDLLDEPDEQEAPDDDQPE